MGSNGLPHDRVQIDQPITTQQTIELVTTYITTVPFSSDPFFSFFFS